MVIWWAYMACNKTIDTSSFSISSIENSITYLPCQGIVLVVLLWMQLCSSKQVAEKGNWENDHFGAYFRVLANVVSYQSTLTI